MRILFWGTYDLEKPRVRLLLAGAKAAGIDVYECHTSLWEGVADKSQIDSLLRRFLLALRWITAYPGLIVRYLLSPAHDVVIVPYLGSFDVIVLWIFARLRGVPIVWDAFLSLYDTMINDRKLLNAKSLTSRMLYAFEWLACRSADLVFTDTQANARYLERLFGLKADTVKQIYVGAELNQFPRAQSNPSGEREMLHVLFYGQFIPLHGMDTIVEAAKRVEQESKAVRWILIGKGQEQKRIDQLICECELQTVERVLWVPYEELHRWIERSDVCLGIFGTTEKALRVIPNKVFQILSVGRPLITADTPGIRELLQQQPGIVLVPPGNSAELANAILRLAGQKQLNGRLQEIASEGLRIGESYVGAELRKLLGGLIVAPA